MTNSKTSHRSNVLMMMAMFSVMVVMSPRPARAQQDVDPTYYDPWAPATPLVHVVSHANAPKKTAQANQAQTAVQAKKEKAKLTSTSAQKDAKLKHAAQAKQS